MNDDVNRAKIAVLNFVGLKPEDHVTDVVIRVSSRGFPTVTVTREVRNEHGWGLEVGQFHLVPKETQGS